MRRVLTVASERAADRFEAWSTILNGLGVRAEPSEADAQPYGARVALSPFASLTHLAFDADNCVIQRLEPQIRRVEWGQYWVYREIGAGAHFQFGEREIATGPGDLVIFDGDAPFQTFAKRKYRHHLWMIPRSAADPHLPNLPRPLMAHLPASLPVCAMIVVYLDELAKRKSALSESFSALVVDHVARLIAVACGDQARDHGEALQSAKLEQARRYIEQNLGSHDLNPGKAAAALGVSVRQLHICFEPTGESFSQYVRRRRLQECSATLRNPASLDRSIADIAFAWGFSSLPTFYRTFSQAFGAAPGDLRQQAVAAFVETSGKEEGEI